VPAYELVLDVVVAGTLLQSTEALQWAKRPDPDWETFSRLPEEVQTFANEYFHRRGREARESGPRAAQGEGADHGATCVEVALSFRRFAELRERKATRTKIDLGLQAAVRRRLAPVQKLELEMRKAGRGAVVGRSPSQATICCRAGCRLPQTGANR
jgi:hypothetical protein